MKAPVSNLKGLMICTTSEVCLPKGLCDFNWIFKYDLQCKYLIALTFMIIYNVCLKGMVSASNINY